MKKVRVEFQGQRPSTLYKSDYPQLVWLLRTKDGLWKQSSGSWQTCRESFASYLRNYANYLNEPNKFPWNGTKMDMKRTRFCMNYKHSMGPAPAAHRAAVNDMKRGVRLVNILERYLGWAKTVVYVPADDERYRVCGCSLFVVSGSPKWMRNSPLISLYLLLLRMGRCKDTAKIKSVSGLIKQAKGMKATGACSGDITFFRTVVPWLQSMLINADYLFFWKTQRQFWPNQTGSMGIDNLVRGGVAGFPEFKVRMEKVKAAKGKKVRK